MTQRRLSQLVALLSILPPLYLACYIYSYSSSLPVHDQWDLVPFLISVKQRHPSLTLLCSFHVDHLIVVPRLCFAGLVLLFGWNNRIECGLTFLFSVIIFIRLSRLLHPGNRLAPWTGLACAILLFGTVQWQIWLWGFLLGWPIPVLALIVATESTFNHKRPAVSAVILILCAMAALLSLASGTFLPVIVALVLLIRYVIDRDRALLSYLLICVALATLAFTLMYFRPVAVKAEGHVALTSVAQSVSLILANPFLDLTRSSAEGAARYVQLSAVISGVLTLHFAYLSFTGFRDKLFQRRLFSVGFALALWSALNALTIAAARGKGGLDSIIQSRYTSYAVLLPIGLLLMLQGVANLTPAKQHNRALIAFSWSILFCLALWPYTSEQKRLAWSRDLRVTYHRLFQVLKVAPVFPVDSELSKICGRPDRDDLIKKASENRLIPQLIPPKKIIPAELVSETADDLGRALKFSATPSGDMLLSGSSTASINKRYDAFLVGSANADGSIELVAPIFDWNLPRMRPSLRDDQATPHWRAQIPNRLADKELVVVCYKGSSNRYFTNRKPIVPH